MPDMRRVALITGGARGIGLGIARALAADAWDLAIAGVRSAAEVHDVISDLESHGGRVHYVQADIGDPQHRIRLLSEVIDRLGTPSALVNNAGRAPTVRADLLQAGEDSFE